MTLKTSDYYSGRDIDYPIRPIKPVVTDRESPAAIRDYADALESFNELMPAYNAAMTSYRKALAARKEELIADLADEYALSQTETEIIFAKAWDDGHSYGIEEVIGHFDDLYTMISRFNEVD